MRRAAMWLSTVGGLTASSFAEEGHSRNCTDTGVDVLCAPETGMTACADVVSFVLAATVTPATAKPIMVPNRTFTSKLNGFTFRFANSHNKELFDENPWAYAPAYGGF